MKKFLSIILMLAMLVPMMSVFASAAAPTNLYDASKAQLGTPPTNVNDNASGNRLYWTAAPIAVKEGDVVTFGPMLTGQGYYITTYDASGAVKISQVKYANCTVVDVVDNNAVIVKWTVPAGVDSFRMATSQMFVDNTLITKNQEFGKADYIAFMEKANIAIPYFKVENAKNLVNLFPTSDSTFAGRGSTSGDIADAKYMTSEYIPVVEGDVIYVAAAASAQSYQLVAYDADKKPTTHVNYKYMVNIGNVDDTHVIYAYRMRPGTAYIRFVAATDVYEAGKQLVTLNQPFDVEGYNNFFNPPVETEPAPETTEPVTPPTTGDSTVIFAVIAVISILGVAVVAKRREF